MRNINFDSILYITIYSTKEDNKFEINFPPIANKFGAIPSHKFKCSFVTPNLSRAFNTNPNKGLNFHFSNVLLLYDHNIIYDQTFLIFNLE